MEKIKDSVESQEQDIMSCDVLNILVFGDHIQLRQNGQSLEPDRKGPENSIYSKLRMHDKAQYDGKQIQPIMWKGVSLLIVTLFYYDK